MGLVVVFQGDDAGLQACPAVDAAPSGLVGAVDDVSGAGGVDEDDAGAVVDFQLAGGGDLEFFFAGESPDHVVCGVEY